MVTKSTSFLIIYKFCGFLVEVQTYKLFFYLKLKETLFIKHFLRLWYTIKDVVSNKVDWDTCWINPDIEIVETKKCNHFSTCRCYKKWQLLFHRKWNLVFFIFFKIYFYKCFFFRGQKRRYSFWTANSVTRKLLIVI